MDGAYPMEGFGLSLRADRALRRWEYYPGWRPAALVPEVGSTELRGPGVA